MTPALPPTTVATAATLAPTAAASDAQMRQAAEAFEAIILRQMLAAVRQGRLADDVFGSGAADNFREVADARLADTLAARRSFGIADMVERQLRANAGSAA
ncbi:MAG: rod-binding protein [Sphingopyxis sp.]|nr:rod-binding protein [Sphingopyxis sp.]